MKDLMHANLGHFVNLMRQQHEIKESDFDAKNIVNVNQGSKPSEELVLWRRRALLINGENNVVNHNDRLVAKIRAPEMREATVRESKARKLANDVEKARVLLAKHNDSLKKAADREIEREERKQKAVSDKAEKIFEKNKLSAMNATEKRLYKVAKLRAFVLDASLAATDELAMDIVET